MPRLVDEIPIGGGNRASLSISTSDSVSGVRSRPRQLRRLPPPVVPEEVGASRCTHVQRSGGRKAGGSSRKLSGVFPSHVTAQKSFQDSLGRRVTEEVHDLKRLPDEGGQGSDKKGTSSRPGRPLSPPPLRHGSSTPFAFHCHYH